MKKILLSLALAASGLSAFAQAQSPLKNGGGARQLRAPVLEMATMPKADVTAPVLGNQTASTPRSSASVTGIPTPAYGKVIGYTRWALQSYGGAHRHIMQYPDGGIATLWLFGRGKAIGGRMAGYNYLGPNSSTWTLSGGLADSVKYQLGGPTATGVDLPTGRIGYPSLTSTLGTEVVTPYILAGAGNNPYLARYTRPTLGTGAWSAIQQGKLAGATGTVYPPFVSFHHATSNDNTIHVVTASSDSSYFGQAWRNLGIKADGLVYMKSTDNGATWSYHLFDSISAANGYMGVKSANYDIDCNGNTVAFVVTGATRLPRFGVECILFKSTDNGNTWKKRVIEKNDASDTTNVNPITSGPSAGNFFVALNDGAYNVSVDKNGVAHVAVGRGFTILDTANSTAGSFWRNGGINAASGAIKYWNDSYNTTPSQYVMKHVAYQVDVDKDGVVTYGSAAAPAPNTYPGDYPHSHTSFPTVATDDRGGVHILYSATVETAADGSNPAKPSRDLYIVSSRDGKVFGPPLNVAGKFFNADDGTSGTGNLEEAWPVGIRKIGPDKKFHFIAHVDGISGVPALANPTAAAEWKDVTVIYGAVNTQDIYNQYISAEFPSSLCLGATGLSVAFQTEKFTTDQTLRVQLDTSKAHAFNTAHGTILELGNYLLPAGSNSGTIPYNVNIPGLNIKHNKAVRVRVAITGPDSIFSRDYEVSLSPGIPTIMGQPTVFPAVTCFDNSLAATFYAADSTTASEYVWTLTPPNAGTLAQSDESNNGNVRATVYWNQNYTGPVTLSVAGKNSCGTGPANTINISTIHGTQLTAVNDPANQAVSVTTQFATVPNFYWTYNGVRDRSQIASDYTYDATQQANGGVICVSLDSNFSCKTCVTIPGVCTQPAIFVGGSTTLCTSGPGSSVTLYAPDTVNGWIWYLGGTKVASTRSYTVNAPGTYTVQTIKGSCTSAVSQPVVISFLSQTPTITATGSTTLCPGSSVTLSAPAGAQYLWSNGEQSQSITVYTPGSYTVQTIASGCTSSASNAIAVTLATAPNPVTVGVSGSTITQTSTSVNGETYQWFRNGVAIPGATSNSYTATTSANAYYYLQVSLNGCVASSQSVTVSVAGVASSAPVSCLIYPNPSKGEFNVRLEGGLSAGTVNIQLFNSLGQLETSELVNHNGDLSTITIGGAGLAKGVYMVKLLTETQVISRKLVIE